MQLSTKPEPCIAEALQRLDTMKHEVTDWEANFLESALRGTAWSEKQRHVLAKMCEEYLEDYTIAAEIRGQQRLL